MAVAKTKCGRYIYAIWMTEKRRGECAVEERKRRFGDRRDGRRIRGLDPMHVFVPYLMPNRADCEAFISEQIDLTNMLQYLEKKNAAGLENKYTFFHVIAAAMVRTLALRPRMNRFIAGRRMYERDRISIAFVAKKQFSDDGHESLLFLDFGKDATIDTVHNRIMEEVTSARSGKIDNSTNFMGILGKLPRFLLSFVMWILRTLDFYGKAPYFLVKEDPDFASVFISNLGSIKLNAAYHHLNNWGTNSVFVVIGERHKAPVYSADGAAEIRDVLNIGITLDERIADGYYYAKTVKLLKRLLQDPSLLERPIEELSEDE